MKLNKLLYYSKLAIVFVTGITPFAFARKFIYKNILNYEIGKRANIGFLTFLDGKKVKIAERAYLSGAFNIFLNIGELEMEPCSKMGAPLIGFNLISGNGKSKLHLKRGARISWGHFFDLSHNITIGAMTIIGGKSCEFFTHDMYNGKRFGPIEIGDECYIGSSCKFSLGVKIPSKSVVAIGAVVTGNFDRENVLIGGIPAKIIREEYGYNALETYSKLNLPH